jgi:hypothetical protein
MQLLSNLVFTQGIVLKTLDGLSLVHIRCEHVMQSELARENILHVVYNVLDIIMKREAVEYMNMLHAKTNIARSIQSRFCMKHTTSHKIDVSRPVVLADRL